MQVTAGRRYADRWLHKAALSGSPPGLRGLKVWAINSQSSVRSAAVAAMVNAGVPDKGLRNVYSPCPPTSGFRCPGVVNCLDNIDRSYSTRRVVTRDATRQAVKRRVSPRFFIHRARFAALRLQGACARREAARLMMRDSKCQTVIAGSCLRYFRYS